jgi:hypothetical protein
MISTSDLRDLANTYGRYDSTGIALSEAADEIDRLRAMLDDPTAKSMHQLFMALIDSTKRPEVSDELG